MGVQDRGDKEPASPADTRRSIVADMLTSIELVEDGSFDQIGLAGPNSAGDQIVTLSNAQATRDRLRSAFGEEFPELFPPLEVVELPPAHEVYAMPHANAHANIGDTWAGQPNSAGA
jgi:hypothetical protein